MTTPDPTPLAWSDGKPTVPGWYWYRESERHPSIMANLTNPTTLWIGDQITNVNEHAGQFAGPIPPPGLEAKEMG